MNVWEPRQGQRTARWILFGTILFPLCWRGQSVSKEAIAHVQCQACEVAVQEARNFAKENAVLDEDSMSDMIEGVCSVKKKEGRWVAQYSLTREDNDAPLIMEKQEIQGFCNNDCLTVQRACEASFKGKEDTLVSLLLAKASVKDLKKKICKKQCGKKLPKLKKWTLEAFKPRDQKEMETEDMIAKMKAETGMGMKMYKREDLMSMSEGDMETMSAREAFSSERAAARMADKEL